jgi:hypothetical protein
MNKLCSSLIFSISNLNFKSNAGGYGKSENPDRPSARAVRIFWFLLHSHFHFPTPHLQPCLSMHRDRHCVPLSHSVRMPWETPNHNTPALTAAICLECKFVCGCEIIGRGLFKVHYFIPLRKHRKSINLKCACVDLEESDDLLISSKSYM